MELWSARGLQRCVVLNVFNTPQFGNPGSSLSTDTYGRITSAAAENPQLELALKYSF